jgi:hypothetical protein
VSCIRVKLLQNKRMSSLVRFFLPVLRDSCFVQLISYAAELVGANPPEMEKIYCLINFGGILWSEFLQYSRKTPKVLLN